jgi:hypothetical protein
MDKLELIKIFKFATFVQNYFAFTALSKMERQSKSDIRSSMQLDLEEEFGNLSSSL